MGSYWLAAQHYSLLSNCEGSHSLLLPNCEGSRSLRSYFIFVILFYIYKTDHVNTFLKDHHHRSLPPESLNVPLESWVGRLLSRGLRGEFIYGGGGSDGLDGRRAGSAPIVFHLWRRLSIFQIKILSNFNEMFADAIGFNIGLIKVLFGTTTFNRIVVTQKAMTTHFRIKFWDNQWSAA